MSDIGDINSPRNATGGSRSTRVDLHLFGKPSDFLETDGIDSTLSEYFVTGLVSSFYAADEWLDQAASAPGELGEAVRERRVTDKALYMSLAMVCKNEALDVVKTMTQAWL